MALYICSTRQVGCGFISHESELIQTESDYDDVFNDSEPGKILSCPSCGADWADAIDESNVLELADEYNLPLAELLVENHASVVGIADCECISHVDDSVACECDVKRARELFDRGQLL